MSIDDHMRGYLPRPLALKFSVMLVAFQIMYRAELSNTAGPFLKKCAFCVPLVCTEDPSARSLTTSAVDPIDSRGADPISVLKALLLSCRGDLAQVESRLLHDRGLMAAELGTDYLRAAAILVDGPLCSLPGILSGELGERPRILEIIKNHAASVTRSMQRHAWEGAFVEELINEVIVQRVGMASSCVETIPFMAPSKEELRSVLRALIESDRSGQLEEIGVNLEMRVPEWGSMLSVFSSEYREEIANFILNRGTIKKRMCVCSGTTGSFSSPSSSVAVVVTTMENTYRQWQVCDWGQAVLSLILLMSIQQWVERSPLRN